MPQISKYPIRKDVANRIFEIFTKVLLATNKKDEAEQLILDFFTPTERIMLAKRLGISLLLEKGYNYQEIKNVLKVSTATIASVNTSRQYGNKGYKKLISKILLDESVNAFFDEVVSKVISLPASLNGKGTGLWKSLAKKKRDKKPF